jgi:hypothetical protein
MKYGIPSDYLPITNTGNLKTQNHQKWIAFREAKGYALQQGVPFDGIDCPCLKDVLSGKGPHVSNHPGNRTFRKIMESRFKEHYDAGSVDRKTEITWEVVREMQRLHARFLIKDKSWWIVVDQDAAREKVSVSFRDMRKSYTVPEKSHTIKRTDTCIDQDTVRSDKKLKIDET